MNGDAECTVLVLGRNESCQNGQLAKVALDRVVRYWVDNGRILKIGRFSVLGDKTLSLEFLNGDSRSLWKEENVPVFVAHVVEWSESGMRVEVLFKIRYLPGRVAEAAAEGAKGENMEREGTKQMKL